MSKKLKKKLNPTGLSRFLQVFNAQPSSPSPSKSSPVTPTAKPAKSIASTSIDTPSTSDLEAGGEFLISTSRGRTEEEKDEQGPPAKKRRTSPGLLGQGNEAYDATDLVPYYTSASQVPEHLQKYFSQRTRFFSLYDQGCLLDEEGWYSVTPEAIALQIAERCRCGTILDAFCGVGGNAIAFAQTCERVIALDTSSTRLALARHNATIYGVADRIEFILGDYISFAQSLVDQPTIQSNSNPPPSSGHTSSGSSHGRRKHPIDVVFLSPPWGGPSYLNGSTLDLTTVPDAEGKEEKQHPEFTLDCIRPIHGRDLFGLSRKITKNVAYYLPRNSNLEEIAELLDVGVDNKESGTAEVDGADSGGHGPEKQGTKRKRRNSDVGGEGERRERVEVEEEWMGNKLKAITAYFGGLAHGQEDLFESGSGA